MTTGLIIEGVAGSGKSTVVKKILELGITKNLVKIVYEEETFGDLMIDLKDKKKSDEDRCYRLRSVLGRIHSWNERDFKILERFHHSYYSLMPNWGLYQSLDKTRKCRALSGQPLVVLLASRGE
jgi:ABC-type dipeptide/oligopeptide/nickel transport system ATPase subunit